MFFHNILNVFNKNDYDPLTDFDISREPITEDDVFHLHTIYDNILRVEKKLLFYAILLAPILALSLLYLVGRITLSLKEPSVLAFFSILVGLFLVVFLVFVQYNRAKKAEQLLPMIHKENFSLYRVSCLEKPRGFFDYIHIVSLGTIRCSIVVTDSRGHVARVRVPKMIYDGVIPGHTVRLVRFDYTDGLFGYMDVYNGSNYYIDAHFYS